MQINKRVKKIIAIQTLKYYSKLSSEEIRTKELTANNCAVIAVRIFRVLDK
jgi:hypothetical protein